LLVPPAVTILTVESDRHHVSRVVHPQSLVPVPMPGALPVLNHLSTIEGHQE
jgi:hypothetical protein